MEKKASLEEKMAALGKEIPGVMGAFTELHREATKDGAISAKMKELMMVALSVGLRCESCIRFHVRAVVKHGASRQEILEATSSAILMAGGPALEIVHT